MKLAAAISALGLLALVGAAPGAAIARPNDHSDRGDSRPHGHYDGGPRGGPQGEQHGRGGPYGPQGGNPYGGNPYGQGGGYGGRPAYSQPHAGPNDYHPSGRRVPLETVVSQMRHRFPGGHLLDADVQEWHGRTVYHVHWATGDGRRIDYIVDAETGQILGQED